jgi:hypothetical protein
MPGLSGFADAPITKALLFFTAVLSVTVHISQWHETVSLDAQKVLSGEVWRLGTCHYMWTDMGATLSGSIVLYSLRHIERQMGSKKFGTFAVLVNSISSGMLLGTGALIPGLELAAGPLPLLFALLLLYYCKYIAPFIHVHLQVAICLQ